MNRRTPLTLALLALSLSLTACLEETRAVDPPIEVDVNAVRPGIPAHRAEVACRDGDQRACRVVTSAEDGIVECYDSIVVCEAGKWSPCLDIETPAAPPSETATETDQDGVGE